MINLKFIHKKNQSSYKTLINCKSIPNYSNKQISHRYINYVYELTLMRRLVWDQNKDSKRKYRISVTTFWGRRFDDWFQPKTIFSLKLKWVHLAKIVGTPPKNGFFLIKGMQTPPLIFDQPIMDDGECAV